MPHVGGARGADVKAQFFTDIDTRHLEGPHRMVLAPFAGYSARYDPTQIEVCANAALVTEEA